MKNLNLLFFLVGVFFLFAFSSSCNKVTEQSLPEEPIGFYTGMQIKSATQPNFINDSARFDVPYTSSTNPHLTFDLFVPGDASATKRYALLIFVHGGSFEGGDKTDAYDNGPTADLPIDIQDYLNNGIAFASVNYRFKNEFTGTKEEKMLACIKDVQRCLQFIRKNAAVYGIKKGRIGMFGTSAGGSAALYLALNSEMADPSSTDFILRESTRLQAVGHNNSQATLSPPHVRDIFLARLCTIPDTGIGNEDVNFISKVTSDDPYIYIRQVNAYGCTPLLSEIAHHRYQGKALYDASFAYNNILPGYSHILFEGINMGYNGAAYLGPANDYEMSDFFKLILLY
jgi:hypothetical protein